MQDQKLMDYFKFDEADLKSNRKGEYSEAQKKRLFRGWFAPKKYLLYKAEGPILVDGDKMNFRAFQYFLCVGRKLFKVKDELLNIIAEGEVYSVYYCNEVESAPAGWNRLDQILSIEMSSGTK
jgi:hypothetical protein